MDSKTFAIDCMSTRSRTQGMPSLRTPPDSFGISTRRAGRGRKAPANRASLIDFHFGLPHFGNFSMLIPSTPGAPLFDLTFFHASATLAAWTMCSTDAKSIRGCSATRPVPTSPFGVSYRLELTSTSLSHCLQTFPRKLLQVLVFG